MSHEATTWVLKHSTARLGDRLVMLAMADHAHPDGSNIFFKLQTIADEALLSVRQVRRAIPRLLESGELTVAAGAGPHGLDLYDMPGVRGEALDASDKLSQPEMSAESSDKLSEPSDKLSGVCDKSARDGDDLSLAYKEVVNHPLTVLEPSPEPSAELVVLDTKAKRDREIAAVFDAWVLATKKTSRTLLDPERRGLIAKALKNYSLEDVLDAVRGWQNSPYHRGENPDGKVFNALDLLLRSPKYIEQFRDFWREPPLPRRDERRHLTAAERSLQNLAEFLDESGNGNGRVISVGEVR